MRSYFAQGVHLNVAIKLFEDGILTLTKAAKLAKMPTEEFILRLASLGIVVADQSTKELEADLEALDE